MRASWPFTADLRVATRGWGRASSAPRSSTCGAISPPRASPSCSSVTVPTATPSAPTSPAPASCAASPSISLSTEPLCGPPRSPGSRDSRGSCGRELLLLARLRGRPGAGSDAQLRGVSECTRIASFRNGPVRKSYRRRTALDHPYPRSRFRSRRRWCSCLAACDSSSPRPSNLPRESRSRQRRSRSRRGSWRERRSCRHCRHTKSRDRHRFRSSDNRHRHRMSRTCSRSRRVPLRLRCIDRSRPGCTLRRSCM